MGISSQYEHDREPPKGSLGSTSVEEDGERACEASVVTVSKESSDMDGVQRKLHEASERCLESTSFENDGEVENNLAMCYIAGSAAVFAASAAGVTWVQDHHVSTLPIMAVRAMVQWLQAVVAIWYYQLDPLGPPECRAWIWVRGVLYWLFMFSWFEALRSLPLGEATTVVYTAPIVTAAIGIVGLQEKVMSPVGYFISIVITMAGVILVAQPAFLFHGTGSSHTSAAGWVWALTSALSAGVIPLLSHVTSAAHWAEVEHVADMMSALLLTPLAMGGFILYKYYLADFDDDSIEGVFSLGDTWWPLLGVMPVVAAFEFVGHIFQTKGYQMGDLVRANALVYIEVPIALCLQWVAFGDAVGLCSGMGAILVLAAGGVAVYATQAATTKAEPGASETRPLLENPAQLGGYPGHDHDHDHEHKHDHDHGHGHGHDIEPSSPD